MGLRSCDRGLANLCPFDLLYYLSSLEDTGSQQAYERFKPCRGVSDLQIALVQRLFPFALLEVTGSIYCSRLFRWVGVLRCATIARYLSNVAANELFYSNS